MSNIEQTLSIIKPDAVAKNVIGQIYARFESAGLKIVASRMAHLSQAEAQAFYGVHKDRPFFKDLVGFMVSGPVMIQVLEGENAIQKNRDLMGATDPKKAAAGTIRADFADSIDAKMGCTLAITLALFMYLLMQGGVGGEVTPSVRGRLSECAVLCRKPLEVKHLLESLGVRAR